MMKPQTEQSNQPCWTCKKYVDGCDWSRSKGKIPVKGWDAELRLFSMKRGKKGVTYSIRSCPEYEYDGT